jgi:phosphate transport system substrate-binding protein
MKKKILFAVVVLAGMAFTIPLGIQVKIKGSDTLLPLAQKWSEIYMKKNPGAQITVTGGGSGVGIAALIDGTTDIASSSRSMKMDEKLKLQEAGVGYKEVIVAYDALAVVVNNGNSVKKLTREQLEGIFTGKITNWNQVGGSDMKIIAYSRESSSGTYEFFKEHVLNKKNYASSCLLMPATGAIIQSVSQTKGAIGYVGLAYENKTVATVSVSYDKGKTYIEPNETTAKNRSYPIVRPLYFYYRLKAEKSVKPLIDFVLSPEGQKIVLEVGYVPLNK